MNKRQKPILIGLAGLAGVGKDTVAQMIIDHHGGGVIRSFADPLKACLKAAGVLTDLDMTDRTRKEQMNLVWGKTNRQIMQLMGTEGFRKLLGDDVWLKLMALGVDRALLELQQEGQPMPVHWIIPDVRFENEAAWVRNNGGAVIHITRPDAQPVSAHASENGVMVCGHDFRIHNGGSLEELAGDVAATMAMIHAAARAGAA